MKQTENEPHAHSQVFFGPPTICSSGFECFANDEGQPHVGLLEIIRHLGTIRFVNRKGGPLVGLVVKRVV